MKLQGTIERFFMVMPSLLLKGFWSKQRIEDNIAIHIHQVKIFFQVPGGKRIIGDIRARHSVEKGHETTLIHLAENIFNRIFF